MIEYIDIILYFEFKIYHISPICYNDRVGEDPNRVGEVDENPV